MRPSPRALAMLSMLVLAPPAAGQRVTARVVDEAARTPLHGVEVRLLSGDTTVATGMTGADGFFRIELPSPGTYVLTLTRDGYATSSQNVTVADQPLTTLPAILLRADAIPLDTVQAQAARRSSFIRTGPTERSAFLVDGARMERLRQFGLSAVSLLKEVAGAQLRVTGDNRSVCAESRRALRSGTEWQSNRPPPCQHVVVILDGINIMGDGASRGRFLASLRAEAYESIEYVPPITASTLYGMEAGASGALVIWSRGMGPHRARADSIR